MRKTAKTYPELETLKEAVRKYIIELSRQHAQLTEDQARKFLQKTKRPELKDSFWWSMLSMQIIVQKLIDEGQIKGHVEGGGMFRSAKFFFDVDANVRLLTDSNNTGVQSIKRSILDLGTKFTRLQVAEIAENCKVTDESMIIATILDMIAKHQVDAQYFTSTKSVAFNQQANIQSRDAFIADLDTEFATWGISTTKSETGRDIPAKKTESSKKIDDIGDKGRIVSSLNEVKPESIPNAPKPNPCVLKLKTCIERECGFWKDGKCTEI